MQKSDSTLTRVLYFCCVVIGAFLATVTVELFISLNDVVLSVRGILRPGDWVSTLPDDKYDLLVNMINRGEIIAPTQLVGSLSTIYNNVIQLLIALIGVVGLFGFLYIRKMSNDEFEDMFAEKNRDFVKSPSIMAQIKDAGDEVMSGYMDDVAAVGSNLVEVQETIDDLLEQHKQATENYETEIADLREQIASLASILAENDDPDDDDRDNAKLEQK